MPSFKPKQPWDAAPHTLAKLEIIRRYLTAWFFILAKQPNSPRVAYIDGFAGPGRYTNADKGSPIVALDAAKVAAQQLSGMGFHPRFQFLFIEKDPELAASLREEVQAQALPNTFEIVIEQGTFNDKVGRVFAEAKMPEKSLVPTFAFVDPFGATGLPFEIIAKLLSHRKCEILLNLDSDGIGRLVTAQNVSKNREHLDVLFGDSDWRSELDPNLPMQRLCGQVLASFKRRLKGLAKYVFAFAMNSRDGQLNYHLVFASQHPLGLEKMKEAMKAVDQTGSYSFSDDTVGQTLLQFDYNSTAVWSERMQKALGGIWRPYSEFNEYALTETPFVNPKAMLQELEKRDLVEVDCLGDRRKGTFPEDKIAKILINRSLL